MNNLPWPIIELAAQKYNIDKYFIAAIIMNESGGNSCAIRYEPQYKYLFFPREFSEQLHLTLETETFAQKTSWGLMQVMGGVARELGFKEHFPSLCNPETGIDWGAKKLKLCIDKTGSMQEAAAMYNAGSVRYTSGKLFENQRYVDGVDTWYRKVKGL